MRGLRAATCPAGLAPSAPGGGGGRDRRGRMAQSRCGRRPLAAMSFGPPRTCSRGGGRHRAALGGGCGHRVTWLPRRPPPARGGGGPGGGWAPVVRVVGPGRGEHLVSEAAVGKRRPRLSLAFRLEARLSGLWLPWLPSLLAAAFPSALYGPGVGCVSSPPPFFFSSFFSFFLKVPFHIVTLKSRCLRVHF